MSSLANTSGAENTTSSAKSPRKASRRRNWLPYILLLPIILYEFALIVYPIVQGFLGSFQQIELASNTPPSWIGLANYQRMLSDPEFYQVMWTTLIFTVLVIIVAIGAGLVTALLFNRAFRFRSGARA